MPQTVERHGRPPRPGSPPGPLVLLDRPLTVRRGSGDPCQRSGPRSRRPSPARIRGDPRPGESAGGRSRRHPRVPGCHARGRGADRPGLRTDRRRGRSGHRVDRDAGRSRSPATKPPTTTISAPARPISATSATRSSAALAGEDDLDLPEAAVLTGEDVTPTRFLSVDWSRGGGIALFAGSPSSHVAMLARSRGVPMVVGLGALDLAGHDAAIVDAYSGRVILSPRVADWSAYEAARTPRPAGSRWRPRLAPARDHRRRRARLR